MAETFIHLPIISNFLLPFCLIFFLVFAILERTKVLGDGVKKLNAMTAFVIALIFVGAIFPKTFVENLILFLTMALVVVFVVLLLWGFLAGGKVSLESGKGKTIAGILAALTVLIFLLVYFDFFPTLTHTVSAALFKQSWSSAFWTNFLFIVVIAIALALVLKSSKGSS